MAVLSARLFRLRVRVSDCYAMQELLEQQYEWVSTPQSGGKPEHVGEMPDFETLDDELRHSTRVVCRMLREAPKIVIRLQEAAQSQGIELETSATMQVRMRHALRGSADVRIRSVRGRESACLKCASRRANRVRMLAALPGNVFRAQGANIPAALDVCRRREVQGGLVRASLLHALDAERLRVLARTHL